MLVEPLIPRFRSRPQGGGTAAVDDRAVFTAIVYVLTSGCAWRDLPPSFGVTVPTAHRRFTQWTRAGLWRRIHVAVLDQLGARDQVDWSRVIVDAAHVRAKKGGSLTGPSAVDRGKTGSKIHVLTDRAGLPLVTGVSGAHTHDSQGLKPLVMGIPAILGPHGRRRRRPRKLHGDKAYDAGHLRAWLRARGITPRIARTGRDTGTRLGRHRWAVERTLSWLTGYRRLNRRYERHGTLFAAFLSLAATLTCWKRLTKTT
ncbi:IS5 family transposase [Saccharothrix mutabilis]